jgi:hypothetical protein
MKPRILFFLSASMILLVLTALVLYVQSNPEKFRYGPVLWAEKLSTKPETYMVLTDPDPYVVEALSNPGSDVFVGSWDNPNIDELIETHRYRTNNVEYSQTYYTITMGSLDPVYGTFFWILIFSWIGLGVSFVVTYVRARFS